MARSKSKGNFLSGTGGENVCVCGGEGGGEGGCLCGFPMVYQLQVFV